MTVLPILAYPLQKILPKFREQGRDGQRQLAFIMAVLGYTLGILCAAISRAPKHLAHLPHVFFLRDTADALQQIHQNPSQRTRLRRGRPIAMLIYMQGISALPMLILLPIVYWARLRMKRHTVSDLLLGTLTPLVSMGLALLVCGFRGTKKRR